MKDGREEENRDYDEMSMRTMVWCCRYICLYSTRHYHDDDNDKDIRQKAKNKYVYTV